MLVRCPAKVNLFLAVGPRDARGYHPLRTIFQAVGLFDELEIEIAGDAHRVTFDDPAVPPENTVTRALRLVAEIAALPPLRVHVRKVIPMESGLEGGSSNAAGILRAAPGLTGMPLPTHELASVAAAIGADVPFFLVGGRARAEGYGERLTPLPDPAPDWCVLVRPPVSCPTGPAYLRLDEIAYEWGLFPEADRLYNDFERVAPCESLDLIERLQVHGARDAALSGSGSAVFGRFESEAPAQIAADSLRAEGYAQVWAVPMLSRQESLAT